MNRRKFLGVAGATLLVAGTTSYLLSDKNNLSTTDLQPAGGDDKTLRPDEKQILFLASLAPSGHNTQPWFVQSLAPYHWIVGSDQSKWLPAVDPMQRETMLFIGAYAAAMGGIDFLALTGGIGEHSAAMRARICKGLEFLGILLDRGRNEAAREETHISAEGSRAAVWRIPTDEERQIARETAMLLSENTREFLK